MDVIRHHDEFVEEEFSIVAIVRESFDQESGGCVFSEDGKALSGNGGNEECAVHFAMVVGIATDCRCGVSRFRRDFQNGTRGLKAFARRASDAALEGPLFHGSVGARLPQRILNFVLPRRV